MRKDEGAEPKEDIVAEFEYVRKKLILQNVAKEEGMSVEICNGQRNTTIE